MESRKFKTNIKCSGCVAKATPYLNEAIGEGNWEVDLQHPDKTLSVTADTEERGIIETLQNAGFEAEML